jgi:molybdate transport system regulatory protein
MSKPKVRIRIDFAPDCAIGPGKIELLEGIERTGSLSAAARDMGMSYRRAWLLVHDTNEAFDEPVAELAVGGREGGGARLTGFGRCLVTDYCAFEAKVRALAEESFGRLKPTGRPARGQSLPRPLRREPAALPRTRTRRTAG